MVPVPGSGQQGVAIQRQPQLSPSFSNHWHDIMHNVAFFWAHGSLLHYCLAVCLQLGTTLGAVRCEYGGFQLYSSARGDGRVDCKPDAKGHERARRRLAPQAGLQDVPLMQGDF